MRSLVLIGAIAVFIGTALMPPNGAPVGAKIIDDVKALDAASVKSFFGGNPVSEVQLLRAGVVVENAVRTPVVQNAIRTVGGAQAVNTLSEVNAIVNGDEAVTPQVAVKVLGTTTKTIADLFSTPKVTDALAYAISTADPARKNVLEKISWARDKDDVRLCLDALDAIDASAGLKSGDVLALCLALVNRESDRCVQVSDSALVKLCQTSLAS